MSTSPLSIVLALLPSRILDKITEDCTGCWVWEGRTVGGGYGTMSYKGKVWRGHRLAWTLVNGPIPTGLDVLHECDVRPCMNPAHLFIGDTRMNMEDMAYKDRGVGGENQPNPVTA